MAVVDYFLKLDGIPGESRDLKHKGEIELESFFWGEANAVIPTGGGGGVGKVQVEDLHIAMKMNKASPLLLVACASGQHIKQAVLTARRALKAQQEFLVYKLTDVLVASYHTTGGTDSVPMDQVAFNFAQVQVEYRSQKPDGSLEAPVKAGWDVRLNKKI
jgi:type VI secretion system secreted protein Hcp